MATAWRWSLFVALVLAFILIPFMIWESPMNALSARWLHPEGSSRWEIGVAVALLLASDVLLPIPSSIISTSAGYLLGIAGGTMASFVGMTAGAGIGYVVGLRAGRSALQHIVTPAQRERLERSAAESGNWLLAAARSVPVLAEASVIVAGAARMPFGRFLAVTSLSNLGIAAVYATAGAMSATTGSFVLALGAALALPLPFLVAKKYWGKRA
jgi:uncharacterized membrane protein YdjX (TVP38/TMEM64 family)